MTREEIRLLFTEQGNVLDDEQIEELYRLQFPDPVEDEDEDQIVRGYN